MLWLLASAASASTLSVNPVLITLDDSSAIAALTVTNRGEHKVVMQASAHDWHIRNNESHYQSTKALVVTPPVFSVAPGKHQIVRIGLRNASQSSTEQAFRVFLAQSPKTPGNKSSASDGKGTNSPDGIRVALRFGIPVFIEPTGDREPNLTWKAKRLADGHLRVEAINNGNAHVKIQHLTLSTGGSVAAQSQKSRYVLPGSRRYWTLDVPTTSTPPYNVTAQDRNGERQATIEPSTL
ncbi:fimbrial biogenesis chaperone [Salinisphaera orenii]|uniref:fimbrial biogenesis chaperone n=1 Tax=Salinisphaera orenii TaxID=856731 RepID=UPI0013A64995|nr:molecular chaperone [Salifodinibacter halophilus]